MNNIDNLIITCESLMIPTIEGGIIGNIGNKLKSLKDWFVKIMKDFWKKITEFKSRRKRNMEEAKRVRDEIDARNVILKQQIEDISKGWVNLNNKKIDYNNNRPGKPTIYKNVEKNIDSIRDILDNILSTYQKNNGVGNDVDAKIKDMIDDMDVEFDLIQEKMADVSIDDIKNEYPDIEKRLNRRLDDIKDIQQAVMRVLNSFKSDNVELLQKTLQYILKLTRILLKWY